MRRQLAQQALELAVHHRERLLRLAGGVQELAVDVEATSFDDRAQSCGD